MKVESKQKRHMLLDESASRESAHPFVGFTTRASTATTSTLILIMVDVVCFVYK